MYLGEDVTFFCEHCKDENMFHFDEFARLMDVTLVSSKRSASTISYSQAYSQAIATSRRVSISQSWQTF